MSYTCFYSSCLREWGQSLVHLVRLHPVVVHVVYFEVARAACSVCCCEEQKNYCDGQRDNCSDCQHSKDVSVEVQVVQVESKSQKQYCEDCDPPSVTYRRVNPEEVHQRVKNWYDDLPHLL